MPHLALALLGPMQVTLDGRLVTGFAYDKARALLAYLAVEAGRAHRREALAALLWPELPAPAARTNLRQVLANVRTALADATAASPFLLITRETVQFNTGSAYDLDVAAFTALHAACERHVHRHRARCRSCMQRLQQADALYQGNFLAEFFVGESAPFEEWALLRREALHRRALEALVMLADYHERRGAYEVAYAYAWRQAALEPWREEAYQQMMRLLALRGQRSAALAQYARCRRVLAQELGVEPMPETTALYDHIRRGGPDVSSLLELVRHQSPSLQLPAPATSFVGREAELAELADLLEDPARRLVTLVGPGGIGKTRLALQAAAEQPDTFADGVAFVPLAALNSADFLVAAIASALNLTFSGAEDPQEQLLRFLRDKEVLLLLDNLEHLLPEVGLLAELLRRAPKVTILATSRELLKLQAEWAVDVSGLQVPAEDRPATIAHSSAVALFLQRAQQAQQSFVLSEAEQPAIVQICRLVEGLPLAIELAAAWVRSLSCREIAHEIARSLNVLTTSLRDVPARHRSLLAAFNHSWKLLSREEQRVLRQLSVFRGGIGRDVAEQVAAASVPLLVALVDKSLLRTAGRQRQGTAQETPRYDLHEMIRQYAWERLVTSGEAATTQARHAAAFLALAEAAAPELEGSEQARWLDRLAGEHDNLRAVLGWARESGQTELGLRVAGAIWRFWYTRGHLSEGRQWLEHLLVQAAGSVSAPVQATARHGAAVLAYTQNDYARAVALSEENLMLYGTLSDTRGMANSLHTLALVAHDQGEYAEATARYEQCLALGRELGDTRAIAAALNGQGVVAHDQGDYARAMACYEQCLALRRELSDTGGMAGALTNLGCLAQYQGDLPRAAARLEEALALLRDLGDKRVMAIALDNLAEVAHDQGDHERASELYVEGLTLKRELNAREPLTFSLEGLARVARAQGRLERAARLFGAAAALRTAIGAPLVPRDRLIYEPIVEATRSALGEDAFAAAWTAGREMSLEQAVTDALAAPCLAEAAPKIDS